MDIKLLFRLLIMTSLGILVTLTLSQSGLDVDLPNTSLTTQQTNSCTGYLCSGVLVDQILVHANGNVFFQVSGDETALSCQLVSGAWLFLNAAKPTFKEMYTGLLASQLAGKQVFMNFEPDPNAPCQIIQMIFLR